MTTDHTQGDWYADQDRGHVAVLCGVKVIAYTGDLNGDDVDESRANAQMIAAAPELLQALQHARRWVAVYEGLKGHDASATQMLKVIDGALIKAGGAA